MYKVSTSTFWRGVNWWCLLGELSNKIFSISASCSGDNLVPRWLKILIPLSVDGLWDAVIMIPSCALNWDTP